jgi:hypothetical protein
MRCTSVVWSAIVLMSALSPAGAAQSAGGAGEGARFAQSPQYPLLPRALEIELALSAAPKHLLHPINFAVLSNCTADRLRRTAPAPARAPSSF